MRTNPGSELEMIFLIPRSTQYWYGYSTLKVHGTVGTDFDWGDAGAVPHVVPFEAPKPNNRGWNRRFQLH